MIPPGDHPRIYRPSTIKLRHITSLFRTDGMLYDNQAAMTLKP